jgi:hypothetical protein
MSTTKRIRKDNVVSTTMSYNCRVLLDYAADARDMNRSEYLRYLLVRDASDLGPVVVAAAAAELLTHKKGRPADGIELTSSFLVDETKAEYGRLLRTFGMFIDHEPIGNALFTKILNEPCIVWNETAYNYDDFVILSKEDREDIIAARLQEIQDQDLANEDLEARL